MGVDIQTYRARIGTNRAAFGVDVMTSVVRLNFRQMCRTTALVIYLLVMFIVAFVNIQELRSNARSVITEKSGNHGFADTETYASTLSLLHAIGAICVTILALRFVSMKGAVRFIGLLLLMAGIESNPGPILPLLAPEFEKLPLVSGTKHSNLFHAVRLNDQTSVEIQFDDMYSIDVDVMCVDARAKPYHGDRRVSVINSPLWANIKCRIKANVEDFGRKLRQSIYTEVNVIKWSAESLTLSPFSYGNSPASLAMVEFTASLLDLKREGTGTLKSIYVVSEDQALHLTYNCV